jgi:hypothetical protein
MIKKIKIILLAISFSVGAVMFFGETTEAALVHFNLDVKEADIGEMFSLEVLLNSEGEAINAVGLTIETQGDKIKLKDWNDGGSIINYWIDKPMVGENGDLNLEGVILGGFNRLCIMKP